MSSISTRIGLLLEAATGGFYVSITRGFLIVMLSYAGYSLSILSSIFLLQAALSVAICIVMYYKYRVRGRESLRRLTILFHALERILWMSLPFAVPFRSLEICLACAAMVCTTPVGIFLNYLVYSQFRGKDAVDIVSKRFALGSVSSIVGALLGMVLVWVIHSSTVYVMMYLLAGAVGLVGSIALLFTRLEPFIPEEVEAVTPVLEIEVRKVNAFLFLILYCAGTNIMYIMWIPFLKSLGASQAIAASLAIIGPVGTIVGSLLWKSPARCRLAMLLLLLSIFPVIIVRIVSAQLVLYLMFSIAAISGFIMSAIVYSTYTREIGTLRVSILSQLGYEAGVALASLITMLVIGYAYLYALALALTGAALAIAYVAIPEFAIIPEKAALYYARLVYTASITSLTYTVLITREAAMLFLRVLALTFLITIIYFLYHLLTILVAV